MLKKIFTVIFLVIFTIALGSFFASFSAGGCFYADFNLKPKSVEPADTTVEFSCSGVTINSEYYFGDDNISVSEVRPATLFGNRDIIIEGTQKNGSHFKFQGTTSYNLYGLYKQALVPLWLLTLVVFIIWQIIRYKEKHKKTYPTNSRI
jgi:hypothetical protein